VSGPERGGADPARLSLNQMTADHLSLPEAVEACARAGIEWFGPWRHKLDGRSPDTIRAAGLRVSSLCRGGFFPAATRAERRVREDDNRRAVEQAAELGTDVLVLVCGGTAGSELAEGRRMVAEGIERLVPFASDHGVRLAIEPLHPMMIVERSVIVTLAQANELAERFQPGEVGVIVDAYHVWWDPELERELDRASDRILGYHVSDWLVPTTDLLAGRGMMGEGAIDLPRIRRAVEGAGYDGPIEAEIINPALASEPADELIARVRSSYLAHA
jgi:sugar phosphate isomerase/epimerase